MFRVVLVSGLLGLVALSGCGAVNQVAARSSCSSMTDEEYTQARDAITIYLELFRAGGMSKSDFLDQVLPSDCEGSTVQQTPYGTMTCSCAIALYTAAADEVW